MTTSNFKSKLIMPYAPTLAIYRGSTTNVLLCEILMHYHAGDVRFSFLVLLQ